jgi:hypothetical protein
MLHIVWHSKKLRVICIYLKSKMATTRGKSFNICPYGKMNSKKKSSEWQDFWLNTNGTWIIIGWSLTMSSFLYARLVLCDWAWPVSAQETYLVLYIESLPNLATWFPCGRGRTLFILGSKVKVTIQHAHLPPAECFLPPK